MFILLSTIDLPLLSHLRKWTWTYPWLWFNFTISMSTTICISGKFTNIGWQHMLAHVYWAWCICHLVQVRDFEYSPEDQESRKEELEKLMQDQESFRSSLLQWCYTSYGEVYYFPSVLRNKVKWSIYISGNVGESYPLKLYIRHIHIF